MRQLIEIVTVSVDDSLPVGWALIRVPVGWALIRDQLFPALISTYTELQLCQSLIMYNLINLILHVHV